MTLATIPITGDTLASGALYVRVRDGAPDQPGDAQIHNLGIRRP